MDLPSLQTDHYTILGLPSGEEGSKLTIQEINKAYKQKALILHPDKNPNDPNSHEKFTQLKSSYEILKHESSRKLFDDLLKIRREKVVRDRQLDAKRRRMVSDLEQRERASFSAVDPERETKAKEEKILRKLDEEVKKIREMLAKKNKGGEDNDLKRDNNGGSFGPKVELDKSRVLKVSWEKGVGGDYTAVRLRELFREFGEVEDVVIRKKRSALIVMDSKEGVAAATGVLIGDLSNPLLVLPLQPASTIPGVRAQEPVANNDGQPVGSVVGAGYQAFENSVLEKLKKAAQKQK
ncbi:hypothetical protein RND81_14G209000 [Saponaria officinalis]|uniref:J domain-containing protein n=1 Tax=Saponaria officinalis TaxID=3572 RepID=A0AAW1GSM2_SAPOF